MSRNSKITNEIVEKFQDYENNNSSFLEKYNDISDFYTMKYLNKGAGETYYSSVPNSATLRACNSAGTFIYRVLTSNTPNFEVIANDVIGYTDPTNLMKIESTIQTQMKLANYNENLLQACIMNYLFGTVVIQQPFSSVKIGNFGRKMPVTYFKPRSMLTIGFDPKASDIYDTNWMGTTDVVSVDYIRNLIGNDPTEDKYIESATNELIDDEDPAQWNSCVRERLDRAGYSDSESKGSYRELISYYGKIDSIGDGLEYIAIVGNRKHLISFYANPSQSGKRPFRVSNYINWELEPLGYGIGMLLGSQQRSINNTQQRNSNMNAAATMGMQIVNKYAGIDLDQIRFQQNGIIQTEQMDAIRPMQFDNMAIANGMTWMEKQQEDFDAASGATKTLQAETTGATATEASIAQNEGVRNLSVRAEHLSEHLVRETVEYMHENNTRNVASPFVIPIKGKPTTIYPSDMLADIDFKVKTTSDKDFRPNRAPQLNMLLQTLTTSKTNMSPEFQQKMLPLMETVVKTLVRDLGADPTMLEGDSSMQNGRESQLAMNGVGAGMNDAMAGNMGNAGQILGGMGGMNGG